MMSNRIWARVCRVALLSLLVGFPVFAPASDKPFRDCPECPEMVAIPPGSFEMGAPPEDEMRFRNEGPVRRVTIHKGFALAKTEVTQRQWRAMMVSNPLELHFTGCDDCPVEKVSWEQAREYLKRLSAKTGKTYRLPSEAEWEYACRAGESLRYCSSNGADAAAWHEMNAKAKTHPVGEKRGNAFGLYDMSGNVWEWVQDCWLENYSRAPQDEKPYENPERCAGRTVRGGSWSNDARSVRATVRDFNAPDFSNNNLGFRPARNLP